MSSGQGRDAFPLTCLVLPRRRQMGTRLPALGNQAAIPAPAVRQNSIMSSRGSKAQPQWRVSVLLLCLWLLLSGHSLAQEPETVDLQPLSTVASNVREGPGLQYPVQRV